MAIEGVDYAGSRPDPAGLFRAGKRFAVRYVGPGGSWKHLTASEAHALTAAGLSIVANAEGTADGLLGGRSTGADWARSADAAARACGMPAGRPIYLSADFDVSAAQWPNVADALRGAASVIGTGRVGVYGGLNAIQWARRDKVAAWFWQTYAWSGGRWAPGNHIEQYRNGVTVAGGEVDLCRALAADYGQWPIGSTSEEDDVSAKDVWNEKISSPNLGLTLAAADWIKRGEEARRAAVALQADMAVVKATVAALAANAGTPVTVDPAALARELLAAMPADLAKQIIDEISARLSDA